jgi:hypothetical protein
MMKKKFFWLVWIVGLSACNAPSQPFPAGTRHPDVYKTEEGALSAYRQAIAVFQGGEIASKGKGGGVYFVSLGAVGEAILAGGLLGDELEAAELGGSSSYYAVNRGSIGVNFNVDARQLPENEKSDQAIVELYGALQKVRSSAIQAIGALSKYGPNTPTALRGHLYALEGYAVIMLADLFCSGVPLSVIDFEADFTYKPGSSTRELYAHAVALFDTAISLSSDSAQILDFARVGQARAYLNLDSLERARAIAELVTPGFVYQIPVNWRGQEGFGIVFKTRKVSVADVKGGRGLPYRSGNDLRTAVVEIEPNIFGQPQYFPQKYGDGYSVHPVTVASHIEARLIEAEALMEVDPTKWLSILNDLRAQANDPALGLLTDPGTQEERVLMMFQERAAWLFLTGHRLGDMRRLVRNYHQPINQVFPTGLYPGFYPERYGTYVNFPIPSEERINPFFTGCLSRGA